MIGSYYDKGNHAYVKVDHEQHMSIASNDNVIDHDCLFRMTKQQMMNTRVDVVTK